MTSSVKPWAWAKALNFSLTSALGVWLRPGQEGNGRSLLCPPLAAPPPARLGPRRAGAYCREWPSGSPGPGCPRCRAERSLRSPSPPPAPPACCPSLGTHERTPVGEPPPDLWPWGTRCPPLAGRLPRSPPPGQVASPCFQPAQPVNSAGRVLCSPNRSRGAQQTGLRKGGDRGVATSPVAGREREDSPVGKPS